MSEVAVCTRCGHELTRERCLICGKPAEKVTMLEQFCKATECAFLRLVEDPEYMPGISRENAEKIRRMQCANCKAWQFYRFLKAGGENVPAAD